MRWLRYSAVCVLGGALIFSAHPETGYCKSDLPEPLKEAFTLLTGIERNLEDRRWEEALAALERLEEVTARAAREVEIGEDENFLHHAGYSCGRLESSLRRRDRDSSEDYYRDLQDLYLRLANTLVKGEPPALAAIIAFLADARDWCGKSNYREVVFELREISRYFRGVYPMLEAKGVEHPEIWGFHGEVNRAMAAAEAGSAPQVTTSLDRLNTMAEGFRSLFVETDVPKAANRR